MRGAMLRRVCWGIALGLTVVPAQADIYYYVDANGVRHFTDNPRGDSRYQLAMKTPVYRSSSKPAGTGSIESTTSGWKLISPQSGRASIGWSLGGGSGKPFQIDEARRRQYAPLIERIATRHGLDAHLVHAVISAESAYNPRAVSSAGAMGLMQLMPATAQRFGVSNAFDPNANVSGGVRYLSWLMDKFNHNVNLALAGYNAGENAVIRHGHKIPPYEETRTYVDRVLRFYRHYRGLAMRQ